ncbi:hypothetical protein FT663_02206 [Candidozyma haemuli var. vulneris]|uniref:Large ribosomal subunit protein uL2m n=1 Tax=Candidozyma haemuli TaxID=45357 RepID=A0A2V1AYV7_9ASCO|nr:ribosomal protein L2 [[Candida] haemuloni]KAF3990195.1 hypothetical protein FT662_02405 [[Candida] haemuloni var. vulneris]KAF3992693.1 hypothetical protein FT663_02206 [[Candida] haemuloni var. vulneris]PVH22041.1 ribosomal protein L2 [[Candida] haemuloni]
MFSLTKWSWAPVSRSFLRLQSTATQKPKQNLFKNEGKTDLEERDETHARQRALLSAEIRLKSYAAGPERPGSTNFRKPIHDHLFHGKPIRALTVAMKKTAGRNRTGHITVRGRGGGHKRRVRLVDFNRNIPGTQKVLRIEYDPNRSGHIALIKHEETGDLSYILAPSGVREGDTVESLRTGIPKDFIEEMNETNDGEIDEALLNSRIMQRGNCMPLSMMPVGAVIHNIGLHPHRGGQLVRSAGTFARLLTKEPNKNRAIVKLSSGEQRYIRMDCCATLGTVSNKAHSLINWGKAGRSRHRGFRPKVRGVAMNANDHPHGGGRGKSKSNKLSQSPWGLKKFVRTRKNKHVNKNKVVDRPRRTDQN